MKSNKHIGALPPLLASAGPVTSCLLFAMTRGAPIMDLIRLFGASWAVFAAGFLTVRSAAVCDTLKVAAWARA